MRDSNLVRVMQAQAKGKVGLVPYPVVSQGRTAIAEAFAAAQKLGQRFVVVDCLTDRDLIEMGAAAAEPCRSSPPVQAWRSACHRISSPRA
ncbi:MAG: four-carbon acid sugar kinase family protein [Hyphomicrobiaceae bacterium]